MDTAYIYCADIYCPSCTLAMLLEERGIEGHGLSHIPSEAIERMGIFQFGGKAYADERNWDSDEFPKAIYVSDAESDSPTYCGSCGLFLDAPLTEDGRRYVIENLHDWQPSRVAELVDAYDLRTEAIEAHYRAYRQDYPTMPAKYAYRSAVEFVDGLGDALDWDDWQERRNGNGFEMRLEREGFDIVIQALDDYDWLSHDPPEFSDRWKDGAILTREWSEYLANESAYYRPHSYRYFHPMITYREHLAGLRKLGYPKGECDRLARSYVAREYRDATSDSRYAYCLVVTAYREGIELGSSAIGGFEVSPDARSRDTEREMSENVISYGLIEDAISEANASLAKLTGKVG